MRRPGIVWPPHPALRMDLLPDVEGSYADRVVERITWLAEVEEAVTEMKPAVDAEARTVTRVYRAYSPSRDEHTTAQEDMGYAAGVAATRNQHAAVTPGPADWTVQTGHIEWEQA